MILGSLRGVTGAAYTIGSVGLLIYQLSLFLCCFVGNKGEISLIAANLPNNTNTQSTIIRDYTHVLTDRIAILDPLLKCYSELLSSWNVFNGADLGNWTTDPLLSIFHFLLL
jgi:hypothetical protein